MAYVDGAFSDRRSKRRALAALGLIAGASFAGGVLRHSGPDTTTFAPTPNVVAEEDGVVLAQPFVEPRPILQAEAPRAPTRRAKSAPAVEVATAEPLEAEVGEAADVAAVVAAPEIVTPPLSLDASALADAKPPE
jgi:hypothetical protein